jgi:hypothetical protein
MTGGPPRTRPEPDDPRPRPAATGTLLLAALVAFASLLAPRAGAAGPPAADVDKAIARAKAFLYKAQRNGTWELQDQGEESPTGRHRGGLTALATYAMVAAGENPQDPRIRSSLEFLKKVDMPSVYALGCRTQLWHLLPPGKEVAALARADAARIIRQVRAGPESRGLFWYPDKTVDGYDMSISQYGVLGLWACQDAGAEVKAAVWDEMDKAWRGKQLKDGAWCYHNNDPQPVESAATPSMTVAGIATLFITHDAVRARDYLGCGGNKTDLNIDRGIDWLTKNFDQVFTGGARGAGAVYYTLYGVERVGVASGLKYFGKHDWFDEGAAFLLKHQNADGSWGSGPGDMLSHNVANVPTTAFALLFLSRGQSPTIISKLQYEPASKIAKPTWNQRPRDCANLSAWLGRSMEHALNWQVTTLDAPGDELHDSPVLYLTGSQELKFTPEQERKLKAYVEDGGLILGNADCASPAFAKSFVALGQRLFPAYEFRALPDDHVIFTNQQYGAATFKTGPAVQGLSNESRELMLLLPNDPSRNWQTPFDGRLEPFALGGDILLYAVDKRAGLRNRNVTYLVRPDPAAKPTRALRVARLSYAGNWDPEPGGWRRLAAVVRNQDKIDLKIDAVALGEGKLIGAAAAAEPAAPPKPDPKELRARAFKRIPPDRIAQTAGDTAKIEALIQSELAKMDAEEKATAAKAPKASAKPRRSPYDVAHLTGTARFRLTPPQVKELRDFVADGGVLLIDSAGGAPAFAEDVDAALAAAFDEAALSLKQPLPRNHALFKLLPAPAAGQPAPDLYRAYARKRLGNTREPRVRGMTVHDRLAVVYSPEDLSTALVGEAVDGITGYDPSAATAIVRQLLVMTAPK